MLNELSQVVSALERVGIVTASRHPRINPMGKNRELLVVRLDDEGEPSDVAFIPGEKATTLFRIEHGSAGSSFPGFNLPAPLLNLANMPAGELKTALEQLCALWKKRNSPTGQILDIVKTLAKSSQPRRFTLAQCKQFERSVVDLVQELQPIFAQLPPELTNLTRLSHIVTQAKLVLPQFSQNVADALVFTAATADRETLLLVQEALFGVLDWKQRGVDFASTSYWTDKAKQDENANQPVYLDLAVPAQHHKPVAHPKTSEAMNAVLVRAADESDAALQTDVTALDAFTGKPTHLQDKFPAPKIAELGNLKLFSVNTNEVQCLLRYGLEGSQQFPASADSVQRMSDALLYLAHEKKKGITCQPIPSAQPNKRDLLIAYLEEAPDFGEAVADLFGGEAQNFSDADFAARTQPVLEALEGRLKTNPSLKVRLLALCSMDKGRKQISLHRQFLVQDVVRATQAWKAGASNAPSISIWFYDRKTKTTVWKSHFVPHPLDVSSVLNRVWSSDPKADFRSSFQRAITASDAYDVFFADGFLWKNKTRMCLALLLNRMASVLVRLGAVKTSGDCASLSDSVRWQCAKSVSLLGIFLNQLGQSKDTFMRDTIYQVGRLLALADSLHFYYCKWVRTPEDKRKQNKVEAPSELLGNSVFNHALDNPTGALARLAERIKPYKAWADTFDGEEAKLVHWIMRQMGESERLCNLEALSQRMTYTDKATLLLGYLADHPKKEIETKQTKTAN